MSGDDGRAVLFAISCVSGINTGLGGHYASLATAADHIGAETRIVVFGDVMPAVLRARRDVALAPATAEGAAALLSSEAAFLARAQVVHAYDVGAALLAQPVAWALGAPLVVTKPGGPPPPLSAPRFRNQVVFHEADLRHFQTAWPRRPKRLALISNRVAAPRDVSAGRPDPFASHPPQEGALRLLRIARLSVDKRRSIEQTIALAARLQAMGVAVHTAIVGAPQDAAVVEALTAAPPPGVRYFTDPAYTETAAELIPYADAVVGTGRSLMEAMAFEKLTFFPVAGGELPCLLTAESYGEAYAENFSDRVRASATVDPEAGLRAFAAMLDDPAARAAYAGFVRARFHDDMSVEGGAKKLRAFYAAARADTAADRAWARAFSVWRRVHGVLRRRGLVRR